MELLEIPLGSILLGDWNPNTMDENMRARLRRCIELFDVVVPLVVRQLESGSFESIGGAQRAMTLRAMGYATAPCVVVKADDTEARLLAQALNRIHGEDDLGLRAELVRRVLEFLPQEEVLSLLPDSAESLGSLLTMGQETIAEYLQNWQRAKSARLKHMTFQLAEPQLVTVEKALDLALSVCSPTGANPNSRGNALTDICRFYLEHGGVL